MFIQHALTYIVFKKYVPLVRQKKHSSIMSGKVSFFHFSSRLYYLLIIFFTLHSSTLFCFNCHLVVGMYCTPAPGSTVGQVSCSNSCSTNWYICISLNIHISKRNRNTRTCKDSHWWHVGQIPQSNIHDSVVAPPIVAISVKPAWDKIPKPANASFCQILQQDLGMRHLMCQAFTRHT
jgi:hypothetical protein